MPKNPCKHSSNALATTKSPFCEKCSKSTPSCSVCKKQSATLEKSHYNDKPICAECKSLQCYRCGEEGYLKTWYKWVMCEECGMELCNKCNGECDKPCKTCAKPCDNCSCYDDTKTAKRKECVEKAIRNRKFY